MYAVSQVVVYSLLFVVMVVNGQDTRGGGRNEPQETLLSTLQEVRNMFENLNERFDRMEGKIGRMEDNLSELKGNISNNLNELRTKQNAFELKMDAVIRSLNGVQGNVTNLSVTSQSNHVDQLNKMEQVAAVVQSKNEEVAQSCVNNVTRQLVVFTEKISNTTQRACEVVSRDCADIRAQGQTTSGVYTVYLNGESQRPLAVYCDMATGSVGWTVFQRRQDGSVDFHRNWRDYQTGFGNINAEFWIGNDNLHLITSGKRYKLRVELTAFDGETAYAEFDDFKVASATDKYRLTSVGNYSGTAGNGLSYHVGQQFTTKDNDNDLSSENCAVYRRGAWWYYYCAFSNLNGFYYQTQTVSRDAVCWYYWKNNDMSMKRTEMKLTPFI